jgi:putative membrane protein
MDQTANGSAAAIFGALGSGLPMLLLQFLLVLLLLAVGIFVYMAVTPFQERELVRNGNPAAATVLGGALVALAIPLAALLATTGALLDILVWGVVALLLQLITVTIVSHLMRGMRSMIEAGQVAAAIPLVASQLAIALLNAAAMVPA